VLSPSTESSSQRSYMSVAKQLFTKAKYTNSMTNTNQPSTHQIVPSRHLQIKKIVVSIKLSRLYQSELSHCAPQTDALAKNKPSLPIPPFISESPNSYPRKHIPKPPYSTSQLFNSSTNPIFKHEAAPIPQRQKFQEQSRNLD